MISIEMDDIKNFMSKLLVKDCFDDYYLNVLEIATSNTFHIDGKLNKQWFIDENENEIEEQEYVLWGDIKKIAYEIIKGNRTPLSMKVILSYSGNRMEKLLKSLSSNSSIEYVGSLYLNIHYNNNQLFITTGVAYINFTMDKSIEKEWDSYIEKNI